MSDQEMKTWPAPFAAIRAGRKHAEFRDLRDRDIHVGDVLTLREWLPDERRYTGEEEIVTVADITTGFGIPHGFAMLSFVRPLTPDLLGTIQKLQADLAAARDALTKIAEWDMLNPPDALADGPWLKQLVGDALARYRPADDCKHERKSWSNHGGTWTCKDCGVSQGVLGAWW